MTRKPRKMPKNQRAYPKKPRLVEVSGTEGRYLLEHQDDIGVPQLYQIKSAQGLPYFYAASAEAMRKWRAFKNTSKGDSCP